MEEVLAQPSHAYGVRGNIFSFLLPWEKIQEKVREVTEEGQLQDWPLAPSQVQHLVRVRLVRGPESLLNKFKELAVRAYVLRDVARIYIENNIHSLLKLKGVEAIFVPRNGKRTLRKVFYRTRKSASKLFTQSLSSLRKEVSSQN